MNLDEFVSQTLTQISRGVKQAQAEAGHYGARVNPLGVYCVRGEWNYSDPEHTSSRGGLQLIDFDVAVTTTDTTGKSGGGGIKVMSIGVGAQGKSESVSSVASRIQFQVAVFLPVDERR